VQKEKAKADHASTVEAKGISPEIAQIRPRPAKQKAKAREKGHAGIVILQITS